MIKWIEYIITIEVPFASYIHKHYVTMADAYRDWTYLQNAIIAFDFKTKIKLEKYVHKKLKVEDYEMLECLDTTEEED